MCSCVYRGQINFVDCRFLISVEVLSLLLCWFWFILFFSSCKIILLFEILFILLLWWLSWFCDEILTLVIVLPLWVGLLLSSCYCHYYRVQSVGLFQFSVSVVGKTNRSRCGENAAAALLQHIVVVVVFKKIKNKRSFKVGITESRRDQEEWGELYSHEEVSPEEIKSREAELGLRVGLLLLRLFPNGGATEFVFVTLFCIAVGTAIAWCCGRCAVPDGHCLNILLFWRRSTTALVFRAGACFEVSLFCPPFLTRPRP